MAKDFRRADRDQVFLLPPDLNDWLPDDHLARFVIDTVEQLDLSAFTAPARLGGVGRRPFDPATLLVLLVYAYANGVRSSRRIEALCEVDVAFRVICANDAPDHTVIARFRSRHENAFADVFTQVLVLCARQGLGRFGVIAVDGTKIAANAAKSATLSEQALRAEAERILAEAVAVDAAEDEEFGDRRGDELPEKFADPRTRKARIKQALEEIAAEKAAEAQANTSGTAESVALWQQRVADAEARVAAELAAKQARWEALQAGTPGRGKRAVPPEEHVTVQQAQRGLAGVRRKLERAQAKANRPAQRRAATEANVTDPHSRLIKTHDGFVQGYNAQLAVTDDQLIAAVAIVNDSNDVNMFVPMMTAAVDAAATIATATGDEVAVGTIVADAGYFSEDNLIAPGPDRLIATSDRRNTARDGRMAPTSGPPPDGATPLDAMRHRMRDPANIEIYKRRGVTVEPVNGQVKDRIGLRRFSRRGRSAALGELNLSAAVHNILKLYRAAPALG